MASITFVNAHFLWALFTIPLMIALHFFLMRFTSRRAVLFANFEALKRVTGGIVLSKNITLLIIRLVIIFLLCFSAAGITLWYTAPGSSYNYVIAIDASSSMLANDFNPNRLEVAKKEAGIFVDKLPGKVNFGVLSFSGLASTELSLSDDRSEVVNALKEVRTSGVGGTDLSGAIYNSVNILIGQEDKSRAIILITDGQHTVGSAVAEGIGYAVDNMVTVHTIGIGTAAGGNFEMNDLLSTLDEDSLKQISEATGGDFHKVNSAQEMNQAFTNLVELSDQNIPINLRLVLLVIALIMLLTEWVLSNSRFKALP